MKEGGEEAGEGGGGNIDLFRLKVFIRIFPVVEVFVYPKSCLFHFYKDKYVHFAVEHKSSGFF